MALESKEVIKSSNGEGNLKNWTLQPRKLNELKPYPKNARLLTKDEEKQLKTSISKFGLIDKLIINTDNTIIGGHQRLQVLKNLNIKNVDCWVPESTLSDEEIEELNIRLNKNCGKWDFDILANEWDADKLMDWGFSSNELFDEPAPKKKVLRVTLEFDHKEDLEDAMESHITEIQSKYQCKVKLKTA